MSRYGLGLIAVTALVVAAAAAHSGLRNIMTVSSSKSAVPEFSDEERGRIFDGIMRVSDAPATEMAASPEVAVLRRRCQRAGAAHRPHPRYPPVRGHKFVKFDDRILVVSSASRLVVAMIPRYKLLQYRCTNADLRLSLAKSAAATADQRRRRTANNRRRSGIHDRAERGSSARTLAASGAIAPGRGARSRFQSAGRTGVVL